ncbi:uncharacterized protein LOC130496951 [Raphanus sativus]|uniref:Uncharacterized protein LOC130496951 n=1 Tax=Raphanus sativus TaxID=3726 RepID=A0A9W3C2G1_RAPSA|nr:uncharacterized protein LOC130496951 [Raphanus sativus]
MELRSDTTTRHEEEIDESWSKWAKTTLESCGLWCGHVKEGPLMEMVMEEGQTRSLEDGDEAAQENTIKSGIEAAHEEKSKLVKVCEVKELVRNYKQGKDEIFQLVGRLREVWLELMARSETIQERKEQDCVFNFLVAKICEFVQYTCDVYEKRKVSTQVRGGTNFRRRRLRKLSKGWFMMRKTWRKGKESCHLSDKMSLKMIKEAAQKVVKGECSYSAYIGSSCEENMVVRKQETKRADDRITKKEWDEFVKYVYALATTRSQGAPALAFTTKPVIIDSGASHHMISDRSLISEVKAAIGIKKATVDLDCQVVFRPNEVEFQDLKTGRIIGRGDSKNQLYHLQMTKNPKPFDSVCLSSAIDGVDSSTWHARLGHPHARAIELILPKLSFNHLECEACILRKHCRTVFSRSETIYEHCFDLVHSDVWTAPCMSRDSQKYFVTFIDEKSKYTWVTMLPSKDRVLDAFINFQAYVANQYNATVKVLRSDNGGEYTTERKNRHLMEVARSMMFHAKVPKRFWSDAVQTACYLINRVPTQILKDLSPFEVLNKNKPSIDHLRGYKCYDPDTRRVLVSREVKFVESTGYYEKEKWEDLEDQSQASPGRANTLKILMEKLGINMSQDQVPRRTPTDQAEEASREIPLDHERGNGTEPGVQEQYGAEEPTHLDHEGGNEHEPEAGGQGDQGSGKHDQDGVGEESHEPEGEVQTQGEEEQEEVQPEPAQEVQAPVLRRSTRQKYPSKWVNTKVYYNVQIVEHPSQAVCSFVEFPEEHYAFMISLDESYVPRSEDQLADVFTKAARLKTMESILSRLGLIDLTPRS